MCPSFVRCVVGFSDANYFNASRKGQVMFIKCSEKVNHNAPEDTARKKSNDSRDCLFHDQLFVFMLGFDLVVISAFIIFVIRYTTLRITGANLRASLCMRLFGSCYYYSAGFRMYIRAAFLCPGACCDVPRVLN